MNGQHHEERKRVVVAGIRLVATRHRARSTDVDPTPARHRLGDLAAVAIYLALGLLVMARYLAHPNAVVSVTIQADNTWFEWVLEHGAYCVRHLDNPFFTRRQHVPDGVNMMANNSVLGVTVPLAPLTMIAGAKVSYVVWMVLGCAGTATTAYRALGHYLVSSRVAAFLGGAFAGFAPGVIHHANGQPNFVANFLLPLILVRVLRLPVTRRWLHDGLVLGLLVVWQLFISEEFLLLTSVTAGGLLIAYLIRRRTGVLRATKALVVAALVAGGLGAYPLWMQFAGPQSYRELPLFHDWGEDLGAFVTMPLDSLGGVATPPDAFGTEQNSWYGWPLLVTVGLLTVLLWRTSKAARVAVAVALIGAVGALGPRIRLDGRVTGVPGPWALEPTYLPVSHLMLPSRIALLTTGALAVLIALGWDELARRAQPGGTRKSDRARLGQLGVAATLIMLVPTPIRATTDWRPPVFISSGAWRAYVPAGTTLVPIPLPDNDLGRGTLTWSVATGLAFPVPAGYFLGPDARGEAHIGGQWDYTTYLIENAVMTGKGAELTPSRRAAVRSDLNRWHASVVVLDPSADDLKPWLDDLFGPSRRVDDVWLWDVRHQ
jgi:hypothetical protein